MTVSLTGVLRAPPECRGSSGRAAVIRPLRPSIVDKMFSWPAITALTAGRGALERAMLRRPSMVRLTVGVSAASARGADELLEAFHSLVVGTRLERGCIGCSAWLEPDSTVHYVEEWATEQDIAGVCSRSGLRRAGGGGGRRAKPTCISISSARLGASTMSQKSGARRAH